MMASPWPAHKAGHVLKKILMKQLGYRRARQSGSHVTLVADGRPAITWAYHNGQTVPPRVLRDILVNQVGLTMDQARKAAGI